MGQVRPHSCVFGQFCWILGEWVVDLGGGGRKKTHNGWVSARETSAPPPEVTKWIYVPVTSQHVTAESVDKSLEELYP